MSPVLAVTRAMLRGWRHEVIRSLGGSRAAYRTILACLLLAATGWVLLALSARNMLGLSGLEGEGGIRLLLLGTTINLAFALAAVVTVGLHVLVPEESAFATLLATMPLTAAQRRVALDAPVLLCGFVAALLVSAPFLWLSLSDVGAVNAAAIVATWLAAACSGVLVGATLQRLATVCAGVVLRLSEGLARPVAAMLVYALLAQQCLLASIGPGQQSTYLKRLLQGLADLCLRHPGVGVGAATGSLLLAALGWWAATSLAGRWAPGRRSHLVGRLAGGIRAVPRPLALLELLQLVRHPVNQSTLLVLGAVSAATAFFRPVRDVLLWPLGGVLLLSVASLVLVGCYGATWSHHWLFRTASAHPVGWVASKWAAATGFWIALLSVLLASFAVTPEWDMRFAVAAAPQVAIAFVMSMLVGLVVPASDEQPLSSVVGVILAAVAGIGLYLAADRVSGGSPAVLFALVGAISALGVAAYVRLARWREHDLVF